MKSSSSNSQLPPSPIKFFSNLEREQDFEQVKVSGEIPSCLNGILVRNGIGIFEQFGKRYNHIFEGDGALSALKLENSQAYTASKIIKSSELEEELKLGRNLYGSKAPWLSRFLNGLKGKGKNTANTHVVPWRDDLYALMEGALPTKINKNSLSKETVTDFKGVIKGTFSAHPHYNCARKSLYNFGIEYGKVTKLHFYGLPDNDDIHHLGSTELEKPVMIHDFIVTENFLIFFIAPAVFNIVKMMLAWGDFIDWVNWDEARGTEIIVVPINEPEKIKRFKTNAFLATHFAGAFEDGDEIVVDYIHHDDFSVFKNLKDGTELNWGKRDSLEHGQLFRARININNESFKTCSRGSGFCDFPRISKHLGGSKYSFIWMQGEEYIDGILRTSIIKISDKNEIMKYLFAKGQISSEPVPILTKQGKEDEGYLISLVFDSNINKSFYIILNSMNLDFVARIDLDQTIPITFHGSWIES